MVITACIPAYNEGRTIYDIIKRCQKHVDNVLVCDDGSLDDTIKRSEEAGALVLKHEQNSGKGAAMKTLFTHAKKMNSDVIVTIDGDGQFLPEDIPKLTAPILEENCDIVIGNRFSDVQEIPKYRKIGNQFFNRITKLATELNIHDTQSGFRSYSKKAINCITFSNDGFSADSEILVSASKNNLKFLEKNVTVIYDTGGKTSTKHPVSHGGEVLAGLLEIIAIKHPLSILGIPGIALTIIGIVFSIMSISFFNDTRILPISLTLISIGTFVSGLLLLLMTVVLFSISRVLHKE